jgi:flagellar FliL protein
MTDAAEVPTEAPAPVKKKMMPIALVIAVGLSAGGLAGAFAIGPKIAGAASVKTEAAAGKGEAKGGKEGKAGESGSEPPVHLLENMVMNPAGSHGSRFLLMSVGLQLKDATAGESIKTREAEIRDLVLRVLGSKSVEELVEISNRESYKKELRTALDSLVGAGKVRAVFFPQFVIQ